MEGHQPWFPAKRYQVGRWDRFPMACAGAVPPSTMARNGIHRKDNAESRTFGPVDWAPFHGERW